MRHAFRSTLALSLAFGLVACELGAGKKKETGAGQTLGNGENPGDDPAGTNSETGTDSATTKKTPKKLPEGTPIYGFSLAEALREDGDLSADDVQMVSCFQGRDLPQDLTKEQFKAYQVVEEHALTDAFKTIELSPASATERKIILLKLHDSTVSHMTIQAMDKNSIYCLDMQKNDFSFLTIERDCASVISVHMVGNKVSHYQWTPEIWTEEEGDPCHPKAVELALDDPKDPATATDSATATDTTTTTAGDIFDLETALKADGDLSEIDQKLVACFKDTLLPSDMTAADVRNYAIYDYAGNTISHATFVNDLETTATPRLAFIRTSANDVSHAYLNLMNKKGHYCLEVDQNKFSFLNVRRDCAGKLKAKFTNNDMSWLNWSDSLAKFPEPTPVCGQPEVDAKNGTL